MSRKYPLLDDKKGLEEKYLDERLSSLKIADLIGCSTNQVLKALKRLGIPVRTLSEANKRYNELFDECWLHEKYSEEGLCSCEIATILGCTHSSVLNALKRFGIPIRTKTEIGLKYKRIWDKLWLEEKYLNEELSCTQIAKIVGCSIRHVSYMLKHFGIPKRGGGYRRGHIPWNNGKHHTEETRRKMRKARKHQISQTHHTKPERIFEAICKKHNLPFKYTGDGTFWIGNLNPDFVECNEKKIAVEVFGGYWHSPLLNPRLKESRTLSYRKKLLKKYGWTLNVFWDTDLLREDAEAFVLSKLKKEGVL